jgi:hypothetical protein
MYEKSGEEEGGEKATYDQTVWQAGFQTHDFVIYSGFTWIGVVDPVIHFF